MSEARQQSSPGPEERRPAPSLGNGAADTSDTDFDAGEAPQASWREDWRSALSQGDETRAKQLERYSTPEALAKTFFEAQQKLRSRSAAAPEPPEEATDVELAAWRKQAGIPAAPEGYEISFPEGTQVTETDQAELGTFLKTMHDKNVAPRAAKAAFEFYLNSRAAAAERLAQASEETTLEHLAQLRSAYPGREYKKNIGLANDFLNSHFQGPENQAALDQILATRMPNGVQLTNFAPFVSAVVAMARQATTEDELISGDAGGGARSVDEEYKGFVAKPKPTEAERARMLQLAEARIKRQERTSGGSPR